MFAYLKNTLIFATAMRITCCMAMGRYSSGQRGRTVNPLRNLRRFESFSPHEKGEKANKATYLTFRPPNFKPAILRLQAFLIRSYKRYNQKHMGRLWRLLIGDSFHKFK
jgi:hypothetical protein